MKRWQTLTYTSLVVLYLLHNDFWLWQRPRLVLGLPVGLLYHLVYCFAAAALLWLLLRLAWPTDLSE